MTDNNPVWPPPPNAPDWPPQAETAAKSAEAPPSVFTIVVRCVLNLLCFCITASVSLFASAVGWAIPPLLVVPVALLLILAAISRWVKARWVKMAFYSAAWGAGVALVYQIALGLTLLFLGEH